MKYKCKEYKVVEEYLDEIIVVKVNEYWFKDKLEKAEIYCPNSKALKFMDSNLTVNAVNASIQTEIYCAEKYISKKKDVECNDFSIPRCVYIIEKYGKQDIVVKVVFDPSDSEVIVCHPSLDNMPVSYKKELFRKKIEEEVRTCEKAISYGVILPVSECFLNKDINKKVR